MFDRYSIIILPKWLKGEASTTLISLTDNFIDTNCIQNDDSMLTRAPLVFLVFKLATFHDYI